MYFNPVISFTIKFNKKKTSKNIKFFKINLKTIINLLTQNINFHIKSQFKGVSFMKKITNSCTWGPRVTEFTTFALPKWVGEICYAHF